MSQSTILVAIGDFAAAAAAVAALVGLRFARQTVREARAERDAAQADRLYQRVERVGEIVEVVYRQGTYGRGLMRRVRAADRSRLGHAMVGLADRLPACTLLLSAETPKNAKAAAHNARQEVQNELERLSRAPRPVRRRHTALHEVYDKVNAQAPYPGSSAGPS